MHVKHWQKGGAVEGVREGKGGGKRNHHLGLIARSVDFNPKARATETQTSAL